MSGAAGVSGDLGCPGGARVYAVRRPGRRSRRGRFSSHWVARCTCGWRGPGRKAMWEAIFDARAHREGWVPNGDNDG